MTIKTIYVARHGYRSNWLPEPHPPNPTGIDSDPPLAPHGVEQAKELANYLTSLPEDERPQFIISSPFYRCLQTSEPIAKALHLKVTIDTGVGEWFKTTREVIPKPAGYEQLRQFFADTIGDETLWSGSGVIPSGSGETEEAIFFRAQKFWKAFIPAFEKAHPEVSRVLFVTHAASKIALGLSLLGKSSVHDTIEFKGKETKLHSGACSIDKFENQNGEWTILENGKTDFLKDGEEMNWNFDVKFEAGSDEDIKARKAAAAATAAAAKNTEFEEVFLTVDIPIMAPSYYEEANRDGPKDENQTKPFSEQLLINPNAKFQISRLDEEHPLFKVSDNANSAADPESLSFSNLSAIDGQIHQTNWSKLLGTELIFNENGDLVGTVREHLLTDSSVKVKLKPQGGDETVEEVPGAESDSRTAFLKKAQAVARAKARES